MNIEALTLPYGNFPEFPVGNLFLKRKSGETFSEGQELSDWLERTSSSTRTCEMTNTEINSRFLVFERALKRFFDGISCTVEDSDGFYIIKTSEDPDKVEEAFDEFYIKFLLPQSLVKNIQYQYIIQYN